jgi:protein-tyrosine phosphatase
MKPDIYWIDGIPAGRLAIMARPRAGDWLEDEIAGWRDEGVGVVVCLLEPNEMVELGLQREPVLCRHHAIDFIAFPIQDRGVPGSKEDTAALAKRLAEWLQDGSAVAIHCRAGIGRSSLIAACILGFLGIRPTDAFQAIGKARGVTVPDTEQQRDWVQTVLAGR